MERSQDLQRPPTQTYGSAFLTKARTLIVRHEGGGINWLYRDNSLLGYATTAVGHMIPDLATCHTLPWLSRLPGTGYDHGIAATPDEINAQYAAVMRMPPGLVASAYAHCSPLRLSLQTVSDILDADIETAITGVTRYLPDFQSLPEPAQLALIDMCFQCGVAGLMSGFPKMLTAIERRDWIGAAQESHRAASSEARNAETRQLLLDAAKGA